MSNQDLQPGEIEEETHIITERIIEEPSDADQEESLIERYFIKGASFTLGAILLISTTLILFGLIGSDSLAHNLLGLLLGLLIVAGIAEYVEE